MLGGDRYHGMNMTGVLRKLSEFFDKAKGRQTTGLFLHDTHQQNYSNWPDSNLSGYKVVDLGDVKIRSMSYLKDVDFVVTCVWTNWDMVVNLLNAIGKPVFWCFNNYVDTSLEVDFF